MDRNDRGSRDRGGSRGGDRDRGFSRGGDRDFGGNRGGGYGGNRGGGRGFSQGPREMHKATCSKCNQECEVPFEPKEGRPVYCKECYRSMKDVAA